jgi:hypothetical protein
MEFEDLQRAWQASGGMPRLTLDPALLLREVRRNQLNFWATIFWRDLREIAVALLMALYFSWHGHRHHDWTDGLLAFACLEVGGFILVDRVRQRRRAPAPADPLRTCIRESLAQVDHQIWLLKNVFWWYLLPISIALLVSVLYRAWREGRGPEAAITGLVSEIVFIALLYWGIYWLNQKAVRSSLEPRRRELADLLASLGPNP